MAERHNATSGVEELDVHTDQLSVAHGKFVVHAYIAVQAAHWVFECDNRDTCRLASTDLHHSCEDEPMRHLIDRSALVHTDVIPGARGENETHVDVGAANPETIRGGAEHRDALRTPLRRHRAQELRDKIIINIIKFIEYSVMLI